MNQSSSIRKMTTTEAVKKTGIIAVFLKNSRKRKRTGGPKLTRNVSLMG